MRQAFAGMLWSKQLYHYDVARWLDGDPGQPPPPGRRNGRNARWRNFDAFDVMSMPDKWEYPWFAAWDLGFHCVALAHVDPAFAKYQLCCCAGSGSSTPTARCPPTSGTSATSTRRSRRGRRSRSSRSTARATSTSSAGSSTSCSSTSRGGSTAGRGGHNLFEGGFLGLDNIGPIDRSHLPVGGSSSSPTPPAGWRSTRWRWRHRRDPEALAGSAGDDLVLKFLEHFAAIARPWRLGVWDEADGFYYDRSSRRTARGAGQGAVDGGIIPLLAAVVVDEERSTAPRASASSSPGCSNSSGDSGTGPDRGGVCARRARRPAAAARRRRRRPPPAVARASVRRGRVPLAVRPARALRLPPRSPVRARRRGHRGHDRLRAGRVHHLDVRRQLELAGPIWFPLNYLLSTRSSATTASSATS